MRKLFYNGDILTMESPRPAEALLTEGGRIIAVGDLSALAAIAGRHAESVDLQGGALLPGFADCHSDFGAVIRAELGAGHGGRAIRQAVRRAEALYAARGITVLHGGGMTEETVRLLHASLPSCKIMVGGAVLTQEYATRMDADAYAKDAMGAVRYAEALL